MKKMFASLAFAAVTTIAASSVMAATLVSDNDLIKLSNGNLASNNYDGYLLTKVTGSQGSFLTFCLEFDEYFSYNETLKVKSISDSAKDGGVGVGTGGVVDQNDPLDSRTAFLYTKFTEPSTTAFDSIANWGSKSDSIKAEAMQQAIWFIENEKLWNQLNALAQALVGIADTAVSGLNPAWVGTGRVQVLNLVHLDGTNSQDQLYLAPVPLPAAGLLMLSALGLGGLMTRRRKTTAEV